MNEEEQGGTSSKRQEFSHHSQEPRAHAAYYLHTRPIEPLATLETRSNRSRRFLRTASRSQKKSNDTRARACPRPSRSLFDTHTKHTRRPPPR